MKRENKTTMHSCYLEYFKDFLDIESTFDDNPEYYLGPNWKTVLCFWNWYEATSFHIENVLKLDDEIRRVKNSRFFIATNTNTLKNFLGLPVNIALDRTAPFKTSITTELIIMDKIIDSGNKLIFTPLIEIL